MNHPGKRILVYHQDEARFGQHGTITRVWARIGSRPRRFRQTQYQSLYIYIAVCPQTGDACGLITPHVNTGTMNRFLEQFAGDMPSDVHAVMVLDQAGWHVVSALKIPPTSHWFIYHPSHRNTTRRKISGTACEVTIGPIGSTRCLRI